ncbi:MAG: multicopper oxidase family protein [Candidatus Competibacterales bacterium]
MNPRLTRRHFLQVGAATALGAGLCQGRAAAAEHTLIPAPARVHLVGANQPTTAVWAFNGRVPGPTLRLGQGTVLRAAVENRLPEATTVHWHGIRLPNAMDGVPHLTQPPIAPGGRFDYRFSVPDAGTFWYHPHVNSSEQIGRGLHGPLIVEEARPPEVDRDLVWVLDDWRLDRQAAIPPFGQRHDMTHAGRIGQVVTLNGAISDRVDLRPHERIRLRLINAANARLFALRFENHHPTVIALDGMPVAPHGVERIWLGPAQRVDLILDAVAAPGSVHRVIDDAYPEGAYWLTELHYGAEVVRPTPLTEVVPLPANPVPEPDLVGAVRGEFRLQGGARGSLRQGNLGGRSLGIRQLVGQGKAWAINGQVAWRYDDPPLMSLQVGQSAVLTLVNETSFPHPMHLHGFHFRLLSRDGEPVARQPWRDTVLVWPRERVEVAFVAERAGQWMFHCHTLAHQGGGLMGVIAVA